MFRGNPYMSIWIILKKTVNLKNARVVCKAYGGCGSLGWPLEAEIKGRNQESDAGGFSMFLQHSITMDILDGLFSWNDDTWQKSVSILSVKRDLLTQNRCTVFTWNSLRKMESPASSKRGLAAHWWPSMSSYATRFPAGDEIELDGMEQILRTRVREIEEMIRILLEGSCA